MHQDISFPYLVKGALERFYQLCREFSDESYRVAEQERQVAYDYLSYCGVKGCEEFVFCEDLALGEEVHDGTLSHVGVTYECYTDEKIRGQVETQMDDLKARMGHHATMIKASLVISVLNLFGIAGIIALLIVR